MTDGKRDVKFAWRAVDDGEAVVPPGAVSGGSVAVGTFRETATGARFARISVGKETAILPFKAARIVARQIIEWCDHGEEADDTESLMDSLTDLGKAALKAYEDMSDGEAAKTALDEAEADLLKRRRDAANAKRRQRARAKKAT